MRQILKRSKKFLSCLMTVIMIMTFLPMDSLVINADDDVVTTDGDGNYVVTDSNGNSLTDVYFYSYDTGIETMLLMLMQDNSEGYSDIANIIVPSGCVLGVYDLEVQVNEIRVCGAYTDEDGNDYSGGILGFFENDNEDSDYFGNTGSLANDVEITASEGAMIYITYAYQLPLSSGDFYYPSDDGYVQITAEAVEAFGDEAVNLLFAYHKLDEEDDESYVWILCDDSEEDGQFDEDYHSWALEECETMTTESYFAFGDIYDSENGEFSAEGDGVTDVDDLRYGYALWIMQDKAPFTEFSYLVSEYNGVSHNTDASVYLAAVGELYDDTTAEINEDAVITVTDIDGETYDLLGYDVTITLRDSSDNVTQEFTSTVYLIPETDFIDSSYQVIVRVGDEFFIRDGRAGDGDYEAVLIDDVIAPAIYIFADFDSKDDIEVFGNNSNMTRNGEYTDVSNTDSYIFFFISYAADFGHYYAGDIAVLKTDYTGFILTGDGEENIVDGWDAHQTFNIVESSDSPVYTVYYGYTSVNIRALSNDILADSVVSEIVSISIEGDIPENGVNVTDNDDGTFSVHFLSDYYNEVTLSIIYKFVDGSTVTRNTTIYRAGVILNLDMTPGDCKSALSIEHGGLSGYCILSDGSITNDESEIANSEDFSLAYYASYYYPTASEATEGNVSLFVTVEYEDGTIESRIIDSQLFTPAYTENGNTHVAVSDYVIYISDGAGDLLTNVTVIAVPKANEEGRFEGAKLGAGKGVSITVNWDGSGDPEIIYQ